MRFDRRKPRSETHDRPAPWQNWKKDVGGAGKRLRQAAEESSADTQNVIVQRTSIQDRLKRYRGVTTALEACLKNTILRVTKKV